MSTYCMISNFYHIVVLSHHSKSPKVVFKRGVFLDWQNNTSEKQAGAAVEGDMHAHAAVQYLA